MNVKSVPKKIRQVQKLAINKKIHIFCQIFMKLGKNDNLMGLSFSPSFMRIGQKMKIFY